MSYCPAFPQLFFKIAKSKELTIPSLFKSPVEVVFSQLELREE
jgi:hypothetical protein